MQKHLTSLLLLWFSVHMTAQRTINIDSVIQVGLSNNYTIRLAKYTQKPVRITLLLAMQVFYQLLISVVDTRFRMVCHKPHSEGTSPIRKNPSLHHRITMPVSIFGILFLMV